MPSTTTTTSPGTTSTFTPLTLLPATFAKISPIPYLTAHLSPPDPTTPPIRPNGRTPSAFRPPSCTTSSLTHCVGSAVVRLGDTAVVCGIQAEILLAGSIPNPPRPPLQAISQTDTAQGLARWHAEELASLNLLVPNVDMATGCSPANLPGGPPSVEAQTLSHRILALLLSSRLVDIEDLRIRHTPSSVDTTLGDSEAMAEDEEVDAPRQATIAYWTLYPSIHVLSLSGSAALFSAAWAALVAALRDVRLPRAWWDEDVQAVLCSDLVAEAKRLRLRGCPVISTWGVFVGSPSRLSAEEHADETVERSDEKEKPRSSEVMGMLEQGRPVVNGRRAWLLADPDGFEDPLCVETVTVIVDCSDIEGSAVKNRTRILKIEKSGGGVVRREEMGALVQMAELRWKEWDEVLNACQR